MQRADGRRGTRLNTFGHATRYADGVLLRDVRGVPVARRFVRTTAGYHTYVWHEICGAVVAGYVTRRFELRPETHCTAAPGEGTDHEGLGACRLHGGNRRSVREAWKMARSIADELNVSPWDALLTEVRRSAGRCAWLDQRLADAAERDDSRRELERAVSDDGTPSDDDGGLPPGLRALLRESRAERRHLAVVAKGAIDAGVAERLVRQVELEGQLVAAALVAGLDALNLTADQRSAALAAAHQKLLAIEPGKGVIEAD